MVGERTKGGRRAPGERGAVRRRPSTAGSPGVAGDRRKVAESLVTLLEGGVTEPTAWSGGQGAGVSLRLVFHHSDDMEDLYREVCQLQFERDWQGSPTCRPDLPLDTRIDQLVADRALRYEQVAVRSGGPGCAAPRAPRCRHHHRPLQRAPAVPGGRGARARRSPGPAATRRAASRPEGTRVRRSAGPPASCWRRSRPPRPGGAWEQLRRHQSLRWPRPHGSCGAR